jgi:hypothetical protein
MTEPNVANIHAATAQHSSDLLSEKMQGVLHHRLSQGLFPHKAPVGYRNLVKGRDERLASGVNIIPDPEQAHRWSLKLSMRLPLVRVRLKTFGSR